MVTRPGRRSAASVVVASYALIMVMTLRPVAATTTLPASCIFCGQLGGVDFALNIVLFIPLGLGLRWLVGNWRTAALIGAGTTLVVEALQWRLIPGRDASLGDLLANTLGTMLGAWLALEGLRWLNATSVAARRLAAAFAILASITIAASAWLLLPVEPRWAQHVQWTPRRPNLDPFPGRLIAVELNGRFIHPVVVLPSQWTFDSATRSLSLRATIGAPVPPTRRQAIIVRIANDFEEGFYLAQWGEAAAFRTHMVGARMRLRPLLVGLKRALPASDTGSDTTAAFIIRANSNSRAIAMSRERLGSETRVTLRRTVGLAWALLLPWDVALGPAWWLANATWLGALVFPVAFFTIRSGRRSDGAIRGIAGWPLPLVLATLLAAPAATGMSPLGVGEWLGVLAGIVTGAAIERWTAAADTDLKVSARIGTIPS